MAFAALGPGSAAAGNFNVSNTNDVAASNPATGCATPNAPPTNGACTLRSSVQAANAASGASTINLAAGIYTLTIGPSGGDDDSTGDLNITNTSGKITIKGAGSGSGSGASIIDGNFTDRVFDVSSSATAEIDKVRIRNGRPPGLGNTTTCPSQPSNSFNGGGIRTRGDLTVNDDVITGNVAIGNGGGIESDGSGSITMNRTDVTNNIACPFFGASGGGIAHRSFSGDVKIDLSNITGNSVSGSNGSGGGLALFTDGTATITRTSISGNDAPNGGGIEASGQKGRATLHLFADLLTGNTASGNGGAGIDTGSASDTVINTTIAGNHGIGIFSSADVLVQYSTLASNDVDLHAGEGGTFTLGNSIVVAGGSGGNCVIDGGGGITAARNNLFDDSGTSCNAGSTDLTNKNPKLGPLKDNGGPTHTRALLTGSPAINAAQDGDCVSQAQNVDQRAVIRPQGPHCDIGAYEYEYADLALTASAAKASINVGETDTVTDVIKNNGPSDDTSVVFTDPAAAGFKIKSAKPSQGTCTHTHHTVKCQIGSLKKGKSATVVIVLQATGPGVITLNSSVTGALPDPNPSNNHATVKINVIKPVVPTCGRSSFRWHYDTADPIQDDRTTLVKVFVDGKHTDTHHGHDIRHIYVKPVPVTGTHHVKVVGYLTDGRRIILRRTYHGCHHGPTHVHFEERSDFGPDSGTGSALMVSR